jgi:hypothetical protein
MEIGSKKYTQIKNPILALRLMVVSMRSSFMFGFLPEQVVEGFVERLGDGDA